MKIVEKNYTVYAYDEDMNEIRIQLIKDSRGKERIFIGSDKEWKKLTKSADDELESEKFFYDTYDGNSNTRYHQLTNLIFGESIKVVEFV